MSGVSIHRRKEDGGWGRDAHARPGNCAVARLGGAEVLAFDLSMEALGPVVVFENDALVANQGGTPIATIDEGQLSAVPLFPGHTVEIRRRPGYPIGRNGVTALVVEASMKSEY